MNRNAEQWCILGAVGLTSVVIVSCSDQREVMSHTCQHGPQKWAFIVFHPNVSLSKGCTPSGPLEEKVNDCSLM